MKKSAESDDASDYLETLQQWRLNFGSKRSFAVSQFALAEIANPSVVLPPIIDSGNKSEYFSEFKN